jgi:hypothetical protein
MVAGTTLTNFLNQLADYGVFAYLIPFLLIYAVVFGILQKAKIFGQDEGKTKGISTIVGLAVAALAIQFDYVSTFFENIFPKFGVALAVFIALVILVGFFYSPDSEKNKGGPFTAVAWVLGVLVVAWALSDWNFAGSSIGVWWYVQEYFWIALILIAIVGVIHTVNGGKDK